MANQQQQELKKSFARVLGFDGPMEGFDNFVRSDPATSARYKGMMSIAEKQRDMAKQNMMKRTQEPKPQMAEGGYMMDRFSQNQQQQGMVGGYVPPPQQSFAVGGLQTLPTAPTPTQSFADVNRPVYDTNPTLTDGTANPNYGKDTGTTTTSKPNIGEIGAQMLTTPGLPVGAAVQAVGVTPGDNQIQQTTTGGVTPNAVAVPTAQASTATAAGQAVTTANQIDSSATSGVVNTALSQTQAAQGTVGTDSQVTAQQQVASSVSELNAAQGVASQMTNPIQRQIQTGELITGAANAETASAYAEQIQAASATPTDQATVAGQLSSLTANFDASNPPAWAAGTLRAVQAQMAARGLGASSMAGQAMIQGALESALPIAQADAQVNAAFETQNLSNRQQRAMLAAQQRATFIGQEFDQAFQARVKNAATIGDVANMNFTAEQNIALENSRAVNSMNLANLGNKQAIVLAEASALSNMDMSNLNNRQQSAVQNASSFMQMDMANLSNTQQGNMFNAQQRIQSLFTDTASENAAKQFNASSQNQVDQFFSQLGQQANQFNATQVNAQEQFNSGQTNTVERFNSELNNARDVFNAQNQQVISQSNANWRRSIASSDTASVNRANELNAQSMLGISNQAYNNLWQYYGDTMEWAWTSAENERSRVIDLAKSQLAADADTNVQDAKNDYASSAAFGGLMTKFIGGALGF
jgi:hypothetical protein|tara:strand:+ start:41 stop:2143 length:2103 start_codon:yes stop_codon:yes gene_type:complete